jgi:hypothetical protein
MSGGVSRTSRESPPPGFQFGDVTSEIYAAIGRWVCFGTSFPLMHGTDKGCTPRFRIHFQFPHRAYHEVEELMKGFAVGLENLIADPIDPEAFVRGKGSQGLHDLL